MSQTTAAALLLLRYLAQSSIAGALASYLFDALRSFLLRAESPSPLRRLGALLSAPRYARYGSLLLAACIGGAANVAIAYLSQGDVGAVMDSVLAGLLTVVASQLIHGQSLSNAVPDMAIVQARLDALKEGADAQP